MAEAAAMPVSGGSLPTSPSGPPPLAKKRTLARMPTGDPEDAQHREILISHPRNPDGSVSTADSRAAHKRSMREVLPSTTQAGGRDGQWDAGDHTDADFLAAAHAQALAFPDNSISTTKYHPLTFLPKCLYEQFRRAANVFFLFVAAASASPVSPVSPVTNVVPLVFVLGVSIIKELVEDIARSRKDDEINNRLCRVLSTGERKGGDGRRGPVAAVAEPAADGDSATDGWAQVLWKNVRVGDLVRVANNEAFPGDLVLLTSALDSGSAYIETSNLDGETNLKLRRAPAPFIDAGPVNADGTRDDDPELNEDFLRSMASSGVECDLPNSSLYTFSGVLRPHESVAGRFESCRPSPDVPPVIPLGPENVLLRGCTLRNTPWAVGLVVYTGRETKVMLNMRPPPSKRSVLERNLDKLVGFLFLLLMLMCISGSVYLGIWVNRYAETHWYLQLLVEKSWNAPDDQNVWDGSNPLLVGGLNFVTLLVLWQTIIPISLYVSVEIVKMFQAKAIIDRDRNMYCTISDTPALARTSNLNEELGQVEYVFTDKTGTLTQNLMEFFKCSIAGVVYGSGKTEVRRALEAKAAGLSVAEAALDESNEPPAPKARERGMNMEDARLLDGEWCNPPPSGGGGGKGDTGPMERASPAEAEAFFRALALCHGVVPEGGTGFKSMKYEAASPDDVALCLAAKHAGWWFRERTTSSCTLRTARSIANSGIGTTGDAGPGEGTDEHYEVLAEVDFTSTRKRASIVVREPWSGKIVCYCKGADNVMLERTARGPPGSAAEALRAKTVDQLDEFSREGLRTLVICQRVIDAAEWDMWFPQYTAAKASLDDREGKVGKVAELLERDFDLLGATAIEDKLQVGVPATIDKLLRAGIRVWVLTGDKMETAINIAFACSLLTDAQEQHIIQSNPREVMEAEERAGSDRKARKEAVTAARKEAVGRQIDELLQTLGDRPGQLYSLVVDGAGLEAALDPDVSPRFLELGTKCQAVVCCRVSPLQKALVTKLVRDGAGKVTLAIGDGANDVSMIQAAHLGVGISGNEGMQAVMASDFAIAQFRFLSELLLVHGSQMYHRVSRLVGYFFYKNFAFTLTSFLWGFHCSMSGQTIYDDWFLTTFNLAFTSLPVLAVGVLDQEVLARTARTVPQLYGFSQCNRNFDFKTLSGWLVNGIIHGILCFFLPLYTLGDHLTAVNGDGLALDLWTTGIAMFTTVIMVVNLRLALFTSHQTILHLVFIYGSIVLWFIFISCYSELSPDFLDFFGSYQLDVFKKFGQLIVVPRFWIGTLLASIVASLLPDALFLLCRRIAKPWDWQLLSEYQAAARTTLVPRWVVYGGTSTEGL